MRTPCVVRRDKSGLPRLSLPEVLNIDARRYKELVWSIRDEYGESVDCCDRNMVKAMVVVYYRVKREGVKHPGRKKQVYECWDLVTNVRVDWDLVKVLSERADAVMLLERNNVLRPYKYAMYLRALKEWLEAKHGKSEI